MKLVPPWILNSVSDAERRVFSFLQQVSFGPGDIALHSLNIGHHEYKRWGEADFVIISVRGILLLEVKGGRVACKNGVWQFTNRNDETNTKKEGPAAQASSAFFSLEKNYLKPRFFRELAGIPMGFGVVLCDVPRLTSTGASSLPELPDEITAYKSDCSGHNAFRDYLERVFDHWESKVTRSAELLPSAIAKIASALRPNFERVPSLDSQLRHVERDLCQFTDEQYQRMDEIADNDRILVSGGAGTGKTFVAAACARYEAADQRRKVLFVTRSPYLASFLATHDFPSNVTIATIDKVASLSGNGPWDTLVVDEGQDLCDPASLDLLEEAIIGGWEKGRWRWFADPNHQVSPSYPVDETSHDYLRSLGFRCHLKQNVRNAGRIVEAIGTFSSADVGLPRGHPATGRVTLECADSIEEIDKQVVKALKGWLSGDGCAARSEVVVLVDVTREPDELAGLITAKGYRAEALSERAMGKSRRDCVLVARIEDFKGLERPLVCIAGISGDGEEMAAKAYKAISRANHEVVLIAPRECLADFARKAATLASERGEAS